MIFACSTRTEMGFFVSEKGVHLTSDADTKCRLKKHKHETETTHDEVKYSSDFQNIYDDDHSECHDPSECPGKSLLWGTSIFWYLFVDRHTPEYHARSKSWIHEEAEREIQKKYHDEDF
jgi:hypothetical protein